MTPEAIFNEKNWHSMSMSANYRRPHFFQGVKNKKVKKQDKKTGSFFGDPVWTQKN
jgi:hypothetical protein